MSRSARIFLFVLLLVAIAAYRYYKHSPLLAPTSEAIAIDDSLSAAYTTFDSCPPEGNAVSDRIGELNKLKNRFSLPRASDFEEDITLDKILEPGNDKDRWSNDKAARIKGYIYDVKSGGVETCNCKEREDQDKDTHIEIVADPMQTGKTMRMVVEVTPRMRDIMEHRGEDWSMRALRDRLLGRWVEVEGWMLFDDEHEMNAENTNPGRPRNWRATAWELHPLTSIRVVDRSLP
jgi:hypothetical protein